MLWTMQNETSSIYLIVTIDSMVNMPVSTNDPKFWVHSQRHQIFNAITTLSILTIKDSQGRYEWTSKKSFGDISQIGWRWVSLNLPGIPTKRSSLWRPREYHHVAAGHAATSKNPSHEVFRSLSQVGRWCTTSFFSGCEKHAMFLFGTT